MTILSTMTGGYLYLAALKKTTVENISAQGAWHAELIQNLMEQHFVTSQRAVRGLSVHKEFRQALDGKNKSISMMQTASWIIIIRRSREASPILWMNQATSLLPATAENRTAL